MTISVGMIMLNWNISRHIVLIHHSCPSIAEQCTLYVVLLILFGCGLVNVHALLKNPGASGIPYAKNGKQKIINNRFQSKQQMKQMKTDVSVTPASDNQMSVPPFNGFPAKRRIKTTQQIDLGTTRSANNEPHMPTMSHSDLDIQDLPTMPKASKSTRIRRDSNQAPIRFRSELSDIQPHFYQAPDLTMLCGGLRDKELMEQVKEKDTDYVDILLKQMFRECSVISSITINLEDQFWIY